MLGMYRYSYSTGSLSCESFADARREDFQAHCAASCNHTQAGNSVYKLPRGLCCHVMQALTSSWPWTMWCPASARQMKGGLGVHELLSGPTLAAPTGLKQLVSLHQFAGVRPQSTPSPGRMSFCVACMSLCISGHQGHGEKSKSCLND